MTTLELDPLLKKGLRLLHSRSKDSVDQLKALLDEAHRQRQGKSLGLTNAKDPFNLRRESPIPRSKQSSPSNITLSKGNDLKRELVHKGRDDESLSYGPKRPKLDSPLNPFKSHTPSPTPSIKSESSSRSRKSDDSDSDADMNDLAMEIGINCTVCKSFEQTSGNQLVECQECHSLFHQECHKPTVSHQDITDPRLVWYCAKCSRSIKKQNTLVSSNTSPSLTGIRSSSSTTSSSSKASASSSSSKASASSSSSKASASSSSSKASASSSSSKASTSSSSSSKAASASSSSSSKAASASSVISSSKASPSKGLAMQRPSPFTNLASVTRSGLGSSNSNSSNSSSSSSSSSNSGSRNNSSSSSSRNSASVPPGANSLLNAERRVHLMKKKAAAKNAERRKI